MSDAEEIAIAKKLPAGSRRALLAMTAEFQLPGKATFNANGAFHLTWIAKRYGRLAEGQQVGQVIGRQIGRRTAYRITPLGEHIRERLIAMGYQP